MIIENTIFTVIYWKSYVSYTLNCYITYDLALQAVQNITKNESGWEWSDPFYTLINRSDGTLCKKINIEPKELNLK